MSQNDIHEVTMPKLGETVTEGELTNWLKQPGEPVAFDDPLFEVSTDKVDSEVPSPYDGVLLEILVPAGQTVPIGTPVARIGEAGAAVTVSSAAAPVPVGLGAAAGGGPSAGVGAPVGGSGSPLAAAVSTAGPAEPGRMLSPLVRRLVAESGLDVATISGTGAGGRIRREDVERAVAEQGAAPAAATLTAPAPPAPAVAPAAPVAPAPAAPQVAPGAARPAAAAAPESHEPAPGTRVVALSKMRLTIAERMTESVRVAPHVWTSVEVDLHAVEQVRERHKARFKAQEGISLTPLAFVARAVCDALRAFPAVNSRLDMANKNQILHDFVHLGMAVDLDEKGLVAPVIRDADGLNLRGMARAIRSVAQKATSGRLAPDDLTGSTFTITSPGPIADYASAPIINQPNSAILSFNMVIRRPVAVGDAVAVHPVSVFGFSYDHRAFDGVTASKFMAHVRDTLQQRDWEGELG